MAMLYTELLLGGKRKARIIIWDTPLVELSGLSPTSLTMPPSEAEALGNALIEAAKTSAKLAPRCTSPAQDAAVLAAYGFWKALDDSGAAFTTDKYEFELRVDASKLAAMVRQISRLTKDGECHACLKDGEEPNPACLDHKAFDMPSDDAVETLHSLISQARALFAPEGK